MEKRVVVAIALTIVLWITFITWFAPKPQAPQPATSGRTPSVATGTRAATGEAPASGPAAAPVAAQGDRRPSKQYPDVPDEKLSNARVDLTFAARGGAVKAADAWGCEYHARDDRSVHGDPGAATSWIDGLPGALAADVLSGSGDVPDLAASNWKLVSRTADSIVWQFEGPGFVLSRTVKLSTDAKHPWHAEVVYSFRNVSMEPGTTKTLEIFGPVTPNPAVGGDTDAGVLLAQSGADGAIERHASADVASLLAENPKLDKRSETGKWAWIAARGDFYLGALAATGDLPPDTTVGLRAGHRVDAKDGKTTPVAVASFRIPLVVPPKDAETSFAFMFYAGPNQRSILLEEGSPYQVIARAAESRGFLGIKLTWISLFLAWLLRQLASTGMGYGLAVISLTILVRGMLFPLSRKSQISMRLHGQKMQRLKPKLDAIKEKYKDAKKQQEATMKVMREEKVSILPGGCLLAFLQMPIWIALFNVLQTTFEMRHAKFLWVSDLTAPDHLLHLPFAEGWPILGGWFNLLPLLMMTTWYASAAMQPLPTDPQQAQTAKMMRWMPVVMGIFLYGYPAGLALYMTMSALWSIGETWLIKKLWLSKLENALK